MNRERNFAQSQTANAGRQQCQPDTTNHHTAHKIPISANLSNNKKANATMPNRTPSKSFNTTDQPLKTVNAQIPAREAKLEKKTVFNKSQAQTMAANRMKKAFVRFDDYLDLNEENMRRSCKRLMNHLYSETTTANGSSQVSTNAGNSSASSVLAPIAISGQAPSKSPATPTALASATAAGAPNSISNRSVNGGRNRGKCISIDNNKSLVQPSPLPPTTSNPAITATTTAPANTNGKSYLRSQYERRQQRQMELMNKMQLEPEGTDSTDGANELQHQANHIKQQQNNQPRQQKHEAQRLQRKQEEQRLNQMQQQDLVAKSHELSKRRFFEKLERRESIKNLNLGYTLNERSISQVQVAASTCTAEVPALIFPQEEVRQISDTSADTIDIQIGAKQKSQDGDKHMLSACQSTVLESNSVDTDKTSGSRLDNLVEGGKTSMSGTPNMVTLDGSDGAVDCGTKELTAELNEFYTPSQRSFADYLANSTAEEQLIEFSVTEHQEQKVDEKFSPTLVVQQVGQKQQLSNTVLAIPSKEDDSAFEINVPSDGSGILSNSHLLKQTDGVISSDLLLGKQVDATSESQSAINLLPESSRPPSANSVAFGFDEPPILSGRQKSEASIQQMTNKIKAPLDDSTDNKVEQIDGQESTTSNGTMASVIRTQATYCKVSVNTDQVALAKLESHLPKIVDNNRQEQAVTSVSLTISTGNGHSNINNAIVNSTYEATNKDQEAISNTNYSNSIKNYEKDSVNALMAAIKVGESFCNKDHEAPETKMRSVEQSFESGIAPTMLDAASSRILTLVGLNSTYSNQTESAAQEQLFATCSRTITNQGARDAPTEASSEVNQKEAVVSDVASELKHNTASATVDVKQQVNESIKEHTMFEDRLLLADVPCSKTDENIYAYPSPHDANDKEIKQNPKNDETCKNGTSDTEPVGLLKTSGHANLVVQKQLGRENSKEEDGGSSCSSSGFGASISDGANSIGDTVILMADNKQHIVETEYRRPNSLAVMSLRGNNDRQDHDYNPIYDSIFHHGNRISNQPLPVSNELNVYQQLVGPDQAYPKNRPLVIENNNYAFALKSRHLSQPSSSIVPACDGLKGEGYANLPTRNKVLSAEYATVRSQTSYNEISITNSDAGSSGCSFSTTSANSGGFSALPPARLECPLPTNNSEISESLSGSNLPKKSSLLRKFGSLVSKAFNTNSVVNSNIRPATPTPMIEKQSENLELPQDESIRTNDDGPRAALVIESDNSIGNNCPAQIGEADLVILQTKHVNQRKQPLLQTLSKQHLEQNSALLRRFDDRLSRGKKHRRRLTRSSSASDFDSESSVSCSSYSSLDIKQRRLPHLKKTESLLDELESLVGLSKSSTYHQGTDEITDSKQASQKSPSHKCQKHTSPIKRRVDIDCISPTDELVTPDVRDTPSKETWNNATKKSVGGPRSLLRLFNAAPSQKVVESTPNLTCAAHTNQSSSGCCPPSDKDSLNQPVSGFWGLSSLIGPSHATPTDATKMKSRDKKQRIMGDRSKVKHDLDCADRPSLVYSNLHSLNAGFRLHLTPQDIEEQHSLSLYQNLLQSYAKRRHRNHHSHHYHHHHHNRRSHHTIPNSRHTHHSATRCAQGCGQSCRASSSSSDRSGNNKRAVVWGQLIKINKSDGSQVVELQRSPGKSWGFFVARGAINNTKGVFISRLHDDVTSNSLTGLLAIGDRILAIDECPIGPDYDILRVNQMISKKSKILLKVKPFKG